MTNKEIIVVDSQRLNTVSQCGYKYDLTFNKRLSLPEKGEALERGDLMHKMLQTYYSMHQHIDRWPNDFRMTKAIEICTRVGEFFAIKMNLPLEEVDDTIRTFKDYVAYYWGEHLVTLAVEQVGSKVLYEDEKLVILYDAKIDWIVRMKNCPVIPVDHKTSKRRGETIALSNQFMGYCWMLGVSNIMVNKIGLQRTLKPGEKFARPILSYPPSLIEAWRQNTIWWVKQIKQFEETGFFPQNFTSCDKYAGCIYRSVCEAPPETRVHTASQLFDIGEEWDVGARL